MLQPVLMHVKIVAVGADRAALRAAPATYLTAENQYGAIVVPVEIRTQLAALCAGRSRRRTGAYGVRTPAPESPQFDRLSFSPALH